MSTPPLPSDDPSPNPAPGDKAEGFYRRHRWSEAHAARLASCLILLTLATLGIIRFSSQITAATQEHRGPLTFVITWNPRTSVAETWKSDDTFMIPAESLDRVVFAVRDLRSEHLAGVPIRLRRTMECWTDPAGEPEGPGGPAGTAELAWAITQSNSHIPDLSTWFGPEDIREALANGKVSSTRLDPWAVAFLAFPLATGVLALYFVLVGVRLLWSVLTSQPPPSAIR